MYFSEKAEFPLHKNLLHSRNTFVCSFSFYVVLRGETHKHVYLKSRRGKYGNMKNTILKLLLRWMDNAGLKHLLNHLRWFLQVTTVVSKICKWNKKYVSVPLKEENSIDFRTVYMGNQNGTFCSCCNISFIPICRKYGFLDDWLLNLLHKSVMAFILW